jgi:hypothetical protein
MSTSVDVLNLPTQSLILLSQAIAHTTVFSIAITFTMIDPRCMHFIGLQQTVTGLIVSVVPDVSPLGRHYRVAFL